MLRVRGTDVDVESTSPMEESLNVVFGGEDEGSDDAKSPRSLAELVAEITELKRDDRARISLNGIRWRLPLRNNVDVRLSGDADAFLQIRR